MLLDNLSAHTSACVAELVEACGGTVRYLPTYSPDLSPIELAFAKLKELVRRAAVRTHEGLEQEVAEAGRRSPLRMFVTFSGNVVIGWFLSGINLSALSYKPTTRVQTRYSHLIICCIMVCIHGHRIQYRQGGSMLHYPSTRAGRVTRAAGTRPARAGAGAGTAACQLRRAFG